MRRIILDAKKMENPAESHEYLKEVFGFPRHYGYNLDALYDCLSEITEEIEVVVCGGEEQGYLKKVLRVLRDVQRENPTFRVTTHHKEEEKWS